MRAAPVGLYFHQDTEALLRIAAAQSALTHAHPTAIASSVASAAAVAWVTQGGALDGLIAFVREKVESLTIAALLEVGSEPDSAELIGVGEMLDQLDLLEESQDGEGWGRGQADPGGRKDNPCQGGLMSPGAHEQSRWQR